MASGATRTHPRQRGSACALPISIPGVCPHASVQGGNLQQVRFYSRILALQIQARMLGLVTPVHDPKGLGS